MRGKGLNMDVIVSAAAELTAKQGYGNFTVRDLAHKLGCKPSSLYNHICCMDEVNYEVGLKTSHGLDACLENAVKNKERDEAVRSAAFAYRKFMKENYELYRSIMGMPSLNRTGSTPAAKESLRIFPQILRAYHLPQVDRICLSRLLGGILHGFVTHEISGYYAANTITDQDSFRFAVDGYLDLVHMTEEKYLPAQAVNE